ncbi:MAG: ribosome maturation factor RimP [Alphaproteobacteria bacterium]|jgi:ribosome maturation factor RimP|nr:ribosome maturation factor RimP [Alphaproteobacteria bacterium]
MNTLEQKVLDLASPVASSLGFAIVDVKTFGKEKITLQIFLEKADGSPVSIDDCAKFSREFAVILDVNDVIENRYNLEVSSAGIDRKLAHLEDFQRFIGQNIALKTKLPVEGQKVFKGKLVKAENNNIEIETEQKNITISMDFIEKANLDILKDLFKPTEPTKNKKGKKRGQKC